MAHPKRNGFTLVELLVVITIIGMLMALLLPAIGAATENARSIQCTNNVKNIALAMNVYESRHNSYPGYVNAVELDAVHSERPFSWLVAILGDLDRSDIHDLWKRSDLKSEDLNEAGTPFIESLTCPSDPPLGTAKPWTSYVANAGSADADMAGCGILHSKYPLHVGNTEKKAVHITSSLDQLASGDGASTTIMVSENKLSENASTWSDSSFLKTKLGTRAKPARVKAGAPTNVFVWNNSRKPKQAWLINGIAMPGSTPLDVARPSSEHRGIVNTAFADGHVVRIKDTIDYTVYARLVSSDGKKCMKNFLRNGSKSQIDHTIPLSDTEY